MSKFITVSKEFVEIFKMFNVVKQTEEMKRLSRKELMLLLIVSVDSFSEENNMVLENLKDFKEELELIYDLQQDKECNDNDLLELAKDTEEKYIDTTRIKTLDEKNLPEPTTDEEAILLRRDITINTIVE